MKNKKTAGIYIHIPFCVKKCYYCDFLSGPASHEVKQAYIDALLREICLTGEICGGKDTTVTSVFFGGGTPSILPGEDIGRILGALGDCFAVRQDAEMTLEANPGTLTKKKLEEYRRLGINRLSIGLQSADNRQLRLLGRIHTYEDFLNTWGLVREAGFDNVNIDLISGLPGQTAADWEETLTKVMGLGPEHISAYSLMIEEGTPFYRWFGESGHPGDDSGNSDFPVELGVKPELIAEEEDREIYHQTKKLLTQHGYDRYEISNYARPGYACRHNLRYWQGGDYLGFGLGAASLWEHVRYSNTDSMETYVSRMTLPDSASHNMPGGVSGGGQDPFLREPIKQLSDIRREEMPLKQQQEMEEFLFLGLRCMEGISTKRFEKLFGKSYEAVYGRVTAELIGKGLLERIGSRVRLSELGIDVSNQVLAEFLL